MESKSRTRRPAATPRRRHIRTFFEACLAHVKGAASASTGQAAAARPKGGKRGRGKGKTVTSAAVHWPGLDLDAKVQAPVTCSRACRCFLHCHLRPTGKCHFCGARISHRILTQGERLCVFMHLHLWCRSLALHSISACPLCPALHLSSMPMEYYFIVARRSRLLRRCRGWM